MSYVAGHQVNRKARCDHCDQDKVQVKLLKEFHFEAWAQGYFLFCLNLLRLRLLGL